MGNSKKGFTLLEIIVAMGIVFVGLISLLTLMNFTFVSSSVSTNRLIAMNLAQEGIEVVRNDRDTFSNWDAWYNSTSDGDYRAEIKLISPYNWSLVKKPTSYQLKYNQTMAIYHHENNGDPLSIFSRKINIQKISNDEKKVTVTIDWTDNKRNYSLTVEHRLYNWHW